MSNKHFDPSECAYELGNAAGKGVAHKLASVGAHQKRRIQKLNEPRVNSIRLRLELLKREADKLRTISSRPRTSSALLWTRRANLVFVGIFGVAGLVFAHLAFSPFNLGWEGWLFSAGLAGVGGYWTHGFLKRYHASRITGVVINIAFSASLAGLIVVALLRGDILAFYLQTALTNQASNIEAFSFYGGAVVKLRWLFALLTVAMELGVGRALLEVETIDITPEREAVAATKRHKEVELEASELVFELTALLNAPDAFEAEFMRDAEVGLLDAAQQSRATWTGRLAPLVLLFVFLSGSIRAQHLRLIVGDDLSLSEKSTSYSAGTEHEKNVEAAAQMISHLPSGAEVSVVGITDDSFSRPLILLSGQVPIDRGPLEFIDQIQIARNRLAAQMRGTIQSVPPRFRTTDALGFFVLVGHMLRDAAHSRRAVVVYSDLRNSASPVNIENPKLVSVSMLKTVEQQHLIADLSGVDVYIYGVHGIGKDVAYWDSLRDFWREYFRISGANLRVFSMMRDVPDLDHAPGSLLGGGRW